MGSRVGPGQESLLWRRVHAKVPDSPSLDLMEDSDLLLLTLDADSIYLPQQQTSDTHYPTPQLDLDSCQCGYLLQITYNRVGTCPRPMQRLGAVPKQRERTAREEKRGQQMHQIHLDSFKASDKLFQ